MTYQITFKGHTYTGATSNPRRLRRNLVPGAVLTVLSYTETGDTEVPPHLLRDRASVSATGRARMSEAKMGGRNPQARKVEVTKPGGAVVAFPSASDAARFFKVPQQVFDLWIKGAWPTEHSRVRNRWVAKYSARFVD